jgi:pimeloyl-ACP methyl ester carboxylesterase
MLAPAFAQAEDFTLAGFVDAVRTRELAVDLVFADIEGSHLTDRSVVHHVWQLVATGRAESAKVWLGGISLGGYVALNVARSHPDALAGMCLLAPYLGSHIIISEVSRGALADWNPAPLDEEDDDRLIWRFIQGRPAAFRIHLGLGNEDRFAGRHRVLAQALPSADVDSIPGGHDWPTWHRLWENFLDARFTIA